MNWKKMKGLIAATFTPMDENGNLNVNLIEKYVQHLLNNCVKHVYVNGTTGEAHSLTVDERMKIAEAWLKYGKNKLETIIIQCGTGSLIETKQLIQHASKIGADCVAVVGPTYFKPATLNDLIDYCADAAKEAPNLPFMYYHIPSETGINFRMTDFLREANSKIPNLIGIKFTSSDLADAMMAGQLFNQKFDILVGADGLILGSLAMGIDGFIGITFNIVGKIVQNLITAFEKGDLNVARQEQIKINEFLIIAHKIGDTKNLVSSLKAIASQVSGIQFGPTRKPISGIEEKKLDEIMQKLKSAKLI